MTAPFTESISERASSCLRTRGREGFSLRAPQNIPLLKSLHFTKPRSMSFWNASEVTRLCKFIGRAFLLWLAALCIDYYIYDSDWHPQQREVSVFFNQGDWIEGEIKSCSSILFNGEFFGIDCSPETWEIQDGMRNSSENHVVPVRFWGSFKADINQLWECERLQTTMTCKLQ